MLGHHGNELVLDIHNVESTYRAPIAPLSASSKEPIPEGPIFGVATGTFPAALFGRFVSAIFALRSSALVLWLRALCVANQGHIYKAGGLVPKPKDATAVASPPKSRRYIVDNLLDSQRSDKE